MTRASHGISPTSPRRTVGLPPASPPVGVDHGTRVRPHAAPGSDRSPRMRGPLGPNPSSPVAQPCRTAPYDRARSRVATRACPGRRLGLHRPSRAATLPRRPLRRLPRGSASGAPFGGVRPKPRTTIDSSPGRERAAKHIPGLGSLASHRRGGMPGAPLGVATTRPSTYTAGTGVAHRALGHATGSPPSCSTGSAHGAELALRTADAHAQWVRAASRLPHASHAPTSIRRSRPDADLQA